MYVLAPTDDTFPAKSVISTLIMCVELSAKVNAELPLPNVMSLSVFTDGLKLDALTDQMPSVAVTV